MTSAVAAIESHPSNESVCDLEHTFALERYAEESCAMAARRYGMSSSSSSQLPEQVEYSTSASSSHMPAVSCEKLKRVDDDADDSTQASEGPRWADLEESDDEKDLIADHLEHEEELLGQGIPAEIDPAQVETKAAKKTSWADLVDDDDSDEGELWPGDREAAAMVADTGSASPSKGWAEKKSKKARPQESAGFDTKGKASRGKPASDAVKSKDSSAKSKRKAYKEDATESVQRRSKDDKAWSRDGGNSTEWSSKGSGKASGKGVGKGANKGSGKGAAKGGAKGKGKGSQSTENWSSSSRYEYTMSSYKKFQCQFIIGIEECTKFKVVRRLLGPRGQNMKDIAENSESKLRLRGRGSKFLEGPEEKESTDDLMLCISSQDASGYEVAQKMVRDLLKGIYKDYEAFCRKAGHPAPALKIQVHEGAREGSR